MLLALMASLSTTPAPSPSSVATSAGGTPWTATIIGWIVAIVVALGVVLLERSSRARDKEDMRLDRLQEATQTLKERTGDVSRSWNSLFNGTGASTQQQVIVDAHRDAQAQVQLEIDRLRKHPQIRAGAAELILAADSVRFVADRDALQRAWTTFSAKFNNLHDAIRTARLPWHHRIWPLRLVHRARVIH